MSDLLTACQMAYRKHVMNDNTVGWSELGDILANSLAEAMGDDEFCQWLREAHKNSIPGHQFLDL
jgi:hypothetical protein